MDTIWSWTGLAALGAFHGINPGMGWLFAVALGMQERSRKAVWRAMLPLAIGHALAIGSVILVALFAGLVVSAQTLKWPIALGLVSLGAYRLFRNCRPGLGGMRVGLVGLTVWSFLMATAHGAGLMVLPLFMNVAPGPHTAHMSAGGPAIGLLATAVHGAGYLIATALLAWVVFEKLGLGVLRRAWINLDLIWAVALIITGGLTLLL